MSITNRLAAWAATLPILAAGAAASAEEPITVIGKPEPGQISFQPMVTDVGKDIAWFHNDVLMPLIVVIAVFVAILMAYTMFRFRAKANPEPRKFSHNTTIEVVWTLVPAIIVFVLAIIGVRQVYFQDAPPEDLAAISGVEPDGEEIVLKAIGHSWYWEYEYPEEGISFLSMMVEEADLEPGQPRLLTTDTHVVLPVNTVIRIQTTASPTDVIHAWTIPAFGVKMDAIPGRLNERWFRVLPGYEGRYYGQCSELCGARHAFMPITVDIVSREEYDAWLAGAREEFGSNETPRPAATIVAMGAE
ncbi:MAG: cytochrome c oxidase subunit II [Alphaproteobacteria bacterium]